MNPPTRLMLMLGLLCGGPALNGCASEEASEQLQPPPANAPCTVDEDCPDPAFFFCNTAASRCEAACRTREDCGAQRRGAYALAECDNAPLGCQCDHGRCVVSLCSRDADCPSAQACRDGRCVAPPPAAAAAACQVTPDFVMGRLGTRVRFDVLVSDSAGQPVVPGESPRWAAVGEAVTGEGSGPGATFTLAAPAQAAEAVEARVGTATCRARVTVLPGQVPEGLVRVVVTDGLTGRPIQEALIIAADAAGTLIRSGTTDASGVALVPASGMVSLTALHAEYGYLTLAHYDTASGSRELSLPLRRNPLELYGGAKGAFHNPPATQNLHLGLAGLSTPGLGLEAAPEQRGGPTGKVSLELGGLARELVLPANAYLAQPSSPGQPEYRAPGVSGVCDGRLPGIPQAEEAIRAGVCGTRTAWALAGDVPPSDFPLSLFGSPVDVSQVLSQSIPLVRRFHSSVVRDVQFRLLPTPGALSGAPDFRDTTHFTPVNHDFQQLPLGFHFAVRVPSLPRYRGAFLDGAFVLGTAGVPGRGLVPLGLGLAVNVSPADPNTDLQAGLPLPGLVNVRMAPTHHGLEGSPYRLLILATLNAALADAAVGAATSALVEPLDGLFFDPKGNKPVRPSGSFLPIPEGARYNFEAAPYRGLEGRQFRFTADPGLSGATVLRVVFTNRLGRQWTVLLDPGRAVPGVRLPVPPAPFEDRTYFGDLNGTRALLQVEALSVREDEEDRGLDPAALAEADGVSLERLGDFTRAWSSLDYRRPEVAWLVPDSDGQIVPRASTVRVRTTGFRVGTGPLDDGFVYLSFNGSATCEGQLVRGEVDTSQGRGEVELTLPSGCSGPEIFITATLVDSTGAPLRPPAFSTRRVHIP